ncbi:hypothetical protein J6590_023625 [Homalodisca vitripennis]|nr:hypothetical protein J6590_023625 [Homalodisca vitripennis]
MVVVVPDLGVSQRSGNHGLTVPSTEVRSVARSRRRNLCTILGIKFSARQALQFGSKVRRDGDSSTRSRRIDMRFAPLLRLRMRQRQSQ